MVTIAERNRVLAEELLRQGLRSAQLGKKTSAAQTELLASIAHSLLAIEKHLRSLEETINWRIEDRKEVV